MKEHTLNMLWVSVGGSYRGLYGETATLEHEKLLPFLNALVGPDQTYQQVFDRVELMLATRSADIAHAPVGPRVARRQGRRG